MNYQSEQDILMHYGVKRRSGRYPWGSGDNPYQHSGDFLSRVEDLKKQGMTEAAIAKSLNLSTTELRAYKAIATNERRSLQVATAKGLREKGYSLNDIAQEMGFKNDSSVRNLLREDIEVRKSQAQKTADILRKQIDEKGMIDVGVGVERELGVSKEKLNQALTMLEAEGYPVYGGGVHQVTNPGRQTNIKVICPPGTEHKDIYDFEKVHSVRDYVSHDGGETFDPRFVYPKSMDSKRMQICYAEDGGIKKDGMVEIRRGVDDLSLGESHYAQVRILVDGTHYIKGMAVYADDLPPGIDVRFNTNKTKGTPKEDVLKKIKDDPDNPFGSLIKDGVNDPDNPSSPKGGQSYYYDKNGKKQLSLINKRAEEGDWGSWKDKLPSQFLSKQSIDLAKKQLNLAASDKYSEFDEILSLTNPTVKKAMLKSFADDCDAAAVHLKAAALPRQKYQVILPIPSMKDKEVYAPNFNHGETVALIRYPHGGTFEIPILKVNNKQPDAKRFLGNTLDAIGINSKVAERLSGADFDGDTVMVVPCNSNRSKVHITSTPQLKGLEGFDPKMTYGTVKKEDGYYNRYGQKIKVMKNTGTEMGNVSNLITDMTLRGALDDEVTRAVRHSMVVIDAEKHKLDYKQSELDNDIKSLKAKYQGRINEKGKYTEGASTLISRSSSEVSVQKRRGQPWINKDTGALEWERMNPKTGKLESKIVYEEYVDKKTGKVKLRTQKSTAMAETSDARSLSSGHPMEEVYADYANRMKALANQARKEMVTTGRIPHSAAAKATYQKEVDSLSAKLNVALKNAPRERQAQTMANAIIKAKKADNPDMTKAEIKKAGQQALTKARNAVGARREPIKLTDREWEAIQAGAISETKLSQIINHVGADELRQRATPRATTALSPAKTGRIKALSSSGYTTAEIAEALGVSTSTVRKYLS